jgi:hypothetical protein
MCAGTNAGQFVLQDNSLTDEVSFEEAVAAAAAPPRDDVEDAKV